MEKNIWWGEVVIPGERYSQARFLALVDAMGLYYGTDEDDVPPAAVDDGDAGFRFDPQSLTDGYADYYEGDRVVAALQDLQAEGEITARYLDSSPEHETSFEALGSTVRIWRQPEEALVTEDLEGYIRLDGILYRLERVTKAERR